MYSVGVTPHGRALDSGDAERGRVRVDVHSERLGPPTRTVCRVREAAVNADERVRRSRGLAAGASECVVPDPLWIAPLPPASPAFRRLSGEPPHAASAAAVPLAIHSFKVDISSRRAGSAAPPGGAAHQLAWQRCVQNGIGAAWNAAPPRGSESSWTGAAFRHGSTIADCSVQATSRGSPTNIVRAKSLDELAGEPGRIVTAADRLQVRQTQPGDARRCRRSRWSERSPRSAR